MLKLRQSEVLRVTREHTCYELAEHYLLKVDFFGKLLLEALDCGVLAAKIFLIMYLNRRVWASSELASAAASYRQKVNVALRVEKCLRRSPHVSFGSALNVAARGLFETALQGRLSAQAAASL